MNETAKSDEIGRRAYTLWEQEGRPHGKDWDHWFRAESEFVAETATLNEPARAARKKPAARPRTGGRTTPKLRTGETSGETLD